MLFTSFLFTSFLALVKYGNIDQIRQKLYYHWCDREEKLLLFPEFVSSSARFLKVMRETAVHSFPDSRSPFPVPRSPFPVPRSPFPVPRSPFPVPRSPFLVLVTSILNGAVWTCELNAGKDRVLSHVFRKHCNEGYYINFHEPKNQNISK